MTSRSKGRLFVGTFYGSRIEHGRINTDWGKVHFAFTTPDGAGAYNISGVVEGGQLRRTTHALGREFLAAWTAKRTGSGQQ